jgi:GNAT superfamily N-acetyltransferase
MSEVVVRRVAELPEDLAPLVVESRALGFEFVHRLREEWRSGANRFDRPGEALFEVRRGDRIVAIGGVNRDPYIEDGGEGICDTVGRVRRFYVAESERRRGVGRLLLVAVAAHAASGFAALRLRTNTPEGAAFYEACGFEPTLGDPSATHAICAPFGVR